MEIIDIDGGQYKRSDNGIFLLRLPNPNEIWIKTSFLTNVEAQNSDFFTNLVKNRQTTRGRSEDHILNDYTKFSLNRQYEIKGERNDCLLFAERVSLNDLNYSKSASVFSVDLGRTSRKFGKSDRDNRQIVNHIRNYKIKHDRLYNFTVNPDIGDAYSMVPYATPIDSGVCPYHAATVIFKDGDTNITIEADAGIELNKPIFDMYSVSLFRHSFFINHVKTYLDQKVSDDGKIKYLLPTVLHLRQTYNSSHNSSNTKTRKSPRSPTRKQPTRTTRSVSRNAGRPRRLRQSRKSGQSGKSRRLKH